MSERDTPPAIVRATLAVTCRGVGDRVIETVVSTASTDRMNDEITQNWDLTAYRRNPVIFWNHQTTELPIAKAIQIGVVDGQLRSRDQFPPAGLHPFADQVHDLAIAGFINAKSAGFKPQKWVYNEQRGGIDYLESELLEHSYVGLPANAEALIAGRTANRAAVEKWLGGARPVLRIGPTLFGRRGVTSCPAGKLCANVDQRENCPAGADCPMSGPARTSWRDQRADEPVLTLIEDRPLEYILDPNALTGITESDVHRIVPLVIDDEIVRTFNKLRGRID